MAFFLSEMIVGAVCLGALDRGSLRGESRQEIPESIKADIRQHGFRVMPGNVMADINSRVDVLMLGVMVTQAQTGIYSLPAMLVDGLFNFTVVLRTIINGKLGRMRAQNDKAGLKKLVKVGVLISFSITLVMALALFLVYPMIIEYGSLSPDFLKGKTALLILLGLFASVSGILPFAMAPNQFGNPGTQTRFYGVVFLSNLFGNLIFIPIWGIEGAALASGLSFVVYGILISRYIQKEVF